MHCNSSKNENNGLTHCFHGRANMQKCRDP